MGPDLTRLKWLGVWLPATSLGVLIGGVWFLGSSFPASWSVRAATYLSIMGLITGGAYLFSNSIFRVIEQKEKEIVRRNSMLAAVNAVGAVINESASFDGVLSGILDTVLEVSGAESGEILLWDEASGTLAVHTVRGSSADPRRRIARFKPGEGLPGAIASTPEPVIVTESAEQHSSSVGIARDADLRSCAGVSLRSKGKLVGVLAIFSRDPAQFTSEDADLLRALGRQIAVAIENARLDARLRAMSVAEERHRIAREMHDGLAQELGFIYLKVGELEANPSLAPIREDIRMIKRVLTRSYEEVRHAIFGLKMKIGSARGLVPALGEYIHEFEKQTEISVKLKVGHEKATRFSPGVEIQLVRIVQEALANVRKHAQAKTAALIFDLEGTEARILIRDDGRGFEPAEVMRPGRPSFGLQTMRERAESAGGRLRIESSEGIGTEVTVWLPLEA